VDYRTTTIYDHLEDLLTERGLTQGRLGVSGEYAYYARELLEGWEETAQGHERPVPG